jgi:hypothetical protein
VFVPGLADRDGVAQQRPGFGRGQALRPGGVFGGLKEPVDRGPGDLQQLRLHRRGQPFRVEFPEGLKLGQPDAHGRGQVFTQGHPGEPPHADQDLQGVIAVGPPRGFRTTNFAGPFRLRAVDSARRALALDQHVTATRSSRISPLAGFDDFA